MPRQLVASLVGFDRKDHSDVGKMIQANRKAVGKGDLMLPEVGKGFNKAIEYQHQYLLE